MTVHKNGGSAEGPSLDRLIKFLRLTASPIDGEALAATRLANRELSRIGGDWEALLRGKVTIITDPFLDGTVGQAAARHSQPVKPPPPPSRPRPQPTAQYGTAGPPPPQPQARPAPPAQPFRTSRPNQFASRCRQCGDKIPIGGGLLVSMPNGGWEVEHSVCPPRQPKPQKKAFVGNKTLDDLQNL